MQTIAIPRSASPTNTSHPLKLIALGDSLIYGYGDPVGGGWVERLRRQWLCPDSPGHVLYNLGIRGNRVAQVSQRLEQEFCQRGELRNRVPDAIILSVGVNDSARLRHPDGRPFTNFTDFQTQLASLLDRAARLCPVLFVGMTPIDEAKMPFLECLYYSHRDQYRYKEATRLACQDQKIPYLDIFDLWRQRGEAWWQGHLTSDGLHPNAQGYQALLQDILHWQPMSQLITVSSDR
ncbi:MAG: GDSL-type esterase/lipase family protein [Cyanophyceae cyanobacterium]